MKEIKPEIFDYAYSPVKSKYNETQRITKLDKKLKIKMYGKRIIKEEKNLDIQKNRSY